MTPEPPPPTNPAAALAFLVSAGADVALAEAPRRWLEAPSPRAAPPAAPVPAAPTAAPAKQPAEHPARACTDVPALLTLLGQFPESRTRPPLLFHGALESRVWVLIDRPDTDPAHRTTIDRMLAAIDLDWHRAALVSLLPWPTPGDGEPTATNLARFTPVVERLADFTPPRLVLALGQIAAGMAGSQARLGSSRGRWFDWRGAQLMPSIHPRAMGDNRELKRAAFEHLKQFRAAIG